MLPCEVRECRAPLGKSLPGSAVRRRALPPPKFADLVCVKGHALREIVDGQIPRLSIVDDEVGAHTGHSLRIAVGQWSAEDVAGSRHVSVTWVSRSSEPGKECRGELVRALLMRKVTAVQFDVLVLGSDELVTSH